LNFAPRAVPPRSWRQWLACAIELSTRRLGAFVGFGVACVALHAVPHAVGLGTALVPLALGIGCLIAECSDRGRPILSTLRDTPRRVHVRLLLAGLVFGLCFWCIGFLVSAPAELLGLEPERLPGSTVGPFASPGAPDRLPPGAAADSYARLIETLCGAWFLAAAVALFGTSVLIGFFVPLLALGRVPLREALVLALAATRLNDFVILFVAALAGTALLGLVTPFLVLPWTAVVSSVLYTAYRDVFLARTENAPAALRAATVASRGPRQV